MEREKEMPRGEEAIMDDSIWYAIRINVIDEMEASGGGFVQKLAAAWRHADGANDRRLREAFWHYAAKYLDTIIDRQNAKEAK